MKKERDGKAYPISLSSTDYQVALTFHGNAFSLDLPQSKNLL